MTAAGDAEAGNTARSEEHTSELQSLAYLVCRLLLEKKNLGPALLDLLCERVRAAPHVHALVPQVLALLDHSLRHIPHLLALSAPAIGAVDDRAAFV